jgi:hypothetical protein
MKSSFMTVIVLITLLCQSARSAQVNSGSDGHDGALNPTSNLVIDMADHPDGIYHYTSVNIPAGLTVSFKPNAKNTPVIWLVQGDCVIGGAVTVEGAGSNYEASGARGGVGGFRGGNAGGGGALPSDGAGPGSGKSSSSSAGGNASYASVGYFEPSDTAAPGDTYGNIYAVPLVGGSGGGGSTRQYFGTPSAGGGGGGAILIAAQSIQIAGVVSANGGSSFPCAGGAGSGGAIRLIATYIGGNGQLTALGGTFRTYTVRAGDGRIRLDGLENYFTGSVAGQITRGFQPIILPTGTQNVQLAIQSLAGVAVPASPSGVLANPDVIIPAQQANPIPIVVRCTNIPLNTEISVVVHPANGPDVQAVGLNNGGTLASSTATVSLNMPRGGGIIYAKAVTGIAGGSASIGNPADAKTRSLAETGWTAAGERFVKIEITAALGGAQRVAYITESGKRYPAN